MTENTTTHKVSSTLSKPFVFSIALAAAMTAGFSTASAAPKKTAPEIQLTEAGRQLEAKYAASLAALKAEIARALPVVAEPKRAALQKASEATKAAQKAADATQQASGADRSGKRLGGAREGQVDRRRGEGHRAGAGGAEEGDDGCGA